MKKYLIFPLIVLLFFAAQACSEDDSAITPEPEPPTVAEMLVGKWLLVSQTAEGTTTTPANECEEKTFIRFNADGLVEQVFYSLYAGVDCEGDYIAAEYSLIDDETIIIYFEGSMEASTIPILSISPNELNLGTSINNSSFKKETGPETE